MPFSGTVNRTYTGSRSTSGVYTFSGSLIRRSIFPRSLNGSFGFTGTLEKVSQIIIRPLVGAVSFATSKLTRVVLYKRNSVGELNTAGSTQRVFSGFRDLYAVLNSSGIIKVAVNESGRAVVGVITFSSTIVRKLIVRRIQVGELNSTGDIQRKNDTLRKITGVLTFEGSKLNIINTVFHKALSGTLGVLSGVVKYILNPEPLSGLKKGLMKLGTWLK